MSLLHRLGHWLRRHPVVATQTSDVPSGPRRGAMDLIVVLDGTLCNLRDVASLTNAGLAYLTLSEPPAPPNAAEAPPNRRALYYEPGLQWEGWRRVLDVVRGRGINRQIRRAYGWLACHYRPGDRIFLLGYSRGAFAVRSLAGVIDRVGLLRADTATERHVQLAWRHYERDPSRPAARAFAARYCHATTPIEMVGVWDTVKALGLRLPLLWMLTDRRHAFHDHRLGPHIRHGYHALAMDETRAVFAPVLWECPQGRACQVEQVWFRGSHADVGGQIAHHLAGRPLSNIPLVWMLERVEGLGLRLPPHWRDRFPCDASAPPYGTWSGFGALFLRRHRRRIGADRSEHIHPSAARAARSGWRGWLPWGIRAPS